MLAAVAVLASAALSPAMAARCRLACDTAAERLDATPACCAEHERQSPAPQDAPGHGDDHDAGCCALACQVCAARPMFAAADSTPLIDLPPVSVAALEPAGPADALDVTFSIFHPPRA